MESATDKTSKCLRCGRTLRVSKTYGPVCRAKIRLAMLNEAIKGFTTRQVDAARELIEDGGLVPTSRKGIYRAASSDGERAYLTHSQTCNCPSGLHRLTACTCKHSLAARILTATAA